MGDKEFNKFFDKLEKIEREELLKKPASQLLLESAHPFDAACIKVKALEDALKELVTLKNMKDSAMDTDDYKKRKPIAWEVARKLVGDYNGQ